MSNHPAKRKPYSFDAFVEEKRDETAIPFTFHGEEFVIPGPDFWPDRLPNAVRQGFDALGRAILGDADWERFESLGGTGRALNAFFAWATEKEQAATTGESAASD